MAIQAKQTLASAHTVNFDTDAQPIGVDNRCTACISHIAEDFEGPLYDSNRRIKGFGGTHTLPILKQAHSNGDRLTMKEKYTHSSSQTHTMHLKGG